MSLHPNMSNVKSDAAVLREKLEKKDPGASEFLEKAEAADVEALKALIVEASNVAVEAKQAMEANETISELKEALKLEKGPFNDSIRISRLRQELLYLYLGDKGAI